MKIYCCCFCVQINLEYHLGHLKTCEGAEIGFRDDVIDAGYPPPFSPTQRNSRWENHMHVQPQHAFALLIAASHPTHTNALSYIHYPS